MVLILRTCQFSTHPLCESEKAPKGNILVRLGRLDRRIASWQHQQPKLYVPVGGSSEHAFHDSRDIKPLHSPEMLGHFGMFPLINLDSG